MSCETINRQVIIAEFHRLMETSNRMKVLRLIGKEKMSKTHLLTKVFPTLARQAYQASCAILDLRNQSHTVPDFLHSACSQLGIQKDGFYYTAYQAWINRPKKVTLKQLLVLMASINISIQDTNRD